MKKHQLEILICDVAIGDFFVKNVLTHTTQRVGPLVLPCTYEYTGVHGSTRQNTAIGGRSQNTDIQVVDQGTFLIIVTSIFLLKEMISRSCVFGVITPLESPPSRNPRG